MKNDKRKYSDRKAYLIGAVQKRRKKLRQMAIEYKGGTCQLCGYDRCDEALEFHHPDSSDKDFGISAKGYTRSWTKVKEELDKCILLCANCHREVHAGLQLSRESGIEKSGEFREIQRRDILSVVDNPEPSPPVFFGGKVQRLSRKGVLSVSGGGEAPDTLPLQVFLAGDDIVQALK